MIIHPSQHLYLFELVDADASVYVELGTCSHDVRQAHPGPIKRLTRIGVFVGQDDGFKLHRFKNPKVIIGDAPAASGV